MLDWPWLQIAGLLLTAYGGFWARKQVKLMEAQSKPKKKGEPLIFAPWWRTPPVIAMTILASLSWVPYFLRPEGEIKAIRSWGIASDIGPDYVQATADGVALAPFRDRFRIGAVAYHYYGTVDIDDVPDLQKSVLYDIRPDDSRMKIPIQLDHDFLDQWHNENRLGTNYRLLLVPNNVNMTAFKTLREARKLGVKVAGDGSGPP